MTTSADSLAAAERRTGARLADGAFRWVLLACVAVYAVALFLPFAGAVSGVQVLLLSDAARALNTTIAEYLFVWLSFVGLGACTTIAMLARRFGLGVIGWVLTVMSAVMALLSVWLRSTSPSLTQSHGAGAYLAMMVVLVASLAYIPAMVRRADEQQAITVERAAAQNDDELTRLQRDAATKPVNPLLVDDRRARAAERRQRHGETS